MSEDHSHDISKHVKVYMAVGIALIVGTVVTVLAANVKIGIILGITLAVIIATVKGALVAGYFMHLFHERKLIYAVLALTAAFIVAMIGLFLFCYGDQQGISGGVFNVPQRHVEVHHGAEHPAHMEHPEK